MDLLQFAFKFLGQFRGGVFSLENTPGVTRECGCSRVSRAAPATGAGCALLGDCSGVLAFMLSTHHKSETPLHAMPFSVLQFSGPFLH